MGKKISNEQLEHIIRIGALERYWTNNRFIALAGNYNIFKHVASLLHVPPRSAVYIADKYSRLRGLAHNHPVFLLDNWSLRLDIGFLMDELKHGEAAGRIRLIEISESDLNPVIPDSDKMTDSELRIAQKQAIWRMFADKLTDNS